ncbi:hypothetical protein C453_19170 [Haloferax elongans ATCC BAA-1513]|uniref:Uncharacterized protein n=1 Tax=Haloferax elongans ATCC BAA-1513 TaxID=1230453 RepID=M0H6W2_HALEO|nr:hypothetical protein C453_19170 [Haloferax elongans ATCC BAA-1513]
MFVPLPVAIGAFIVACWNSYTNDGVVTSLLLAFGVAFGFHAAWQLGLTYLPLAQRVANLAVGLTILFALLYAVLFGGVGYLTGRLGKIAVA